jgi:hypothetical protein
VAFSAEPTTANAPPVRLTLSGQNFGPTTAQPDPDLEVSYTYASARNALLDGAPLTMRAANCQVTQTNVRIECDSAAGAGSGLGFFIDLNGDVSETKETALRYAAPTVTKVVVATLRPGLNNNGGRLLDDDSAWVAGPDGNAAMETTGGQRLEVHGTNFGDGNALNDFVLKYGTPGAWLTTDVCRPPKAAPAGGAHTVMYCESAPGVGSRLEFVASVGGTESTPPCATNDCLASYKVIGQSVVCVCVCERERE